MVYSSQQCNSGGTARYAEEGSHGGIRGEAVGHREQVQGGGEQLAEDEYRLLNHDLYWDLPDSDRGGQHLHGNFILPSLYSGITRYHISIRVTWFPRSYPEWACFLETAWVI